MKIAITGATGFVGRHLARSLSYRGHELVLIARGVDGRDRTVRRLNCPPVSAASKRRTTSSTATGRTGASLQPTRANSRTVMIERAR